MRFFFLDFSVFAQWASGLSQQQPSDYKSFFFSKEKIMRITLYILKEKKKKSEVSS